MTSRFRAGDAIRHRRTGGHYVVVGTPERVRLEATGEAAYLYESPGGIVWCRCQREMEDGRFELADRQLPDATPQQGDL